MHKFPDIPMVEIGPGSQVDEGEGELTYMETPGQMETYHQPVMPEPEDVGDISLGKMLLEEILMALYQYQAGKPAKSFDMEHMGAQDVDFVNQALGEGEVSVSFDGASPIRAQESVLAGVWRVQHFDAHDNVVRDTIEVGDIPHMVRNFTFANARKTVDTAFDQNNPMIQNAPALLTEIADHMAEYKSGDPAHAINMTLLPLTEDDVLLLGERMGVGPVTILSRGYGNCRIGSTSQQDVWWIKYFNSEDKLILNSIEIVDVPEVCLAAPEDIADSAERLNEILELYR